MKDNHSGQAGLRSLAASLLLTADPAAAAESPFLGVYLQTPFVAQASSDEEPSFFRPTVEIDLRLSVGNEEAELPLVLKRPLEQLARWSLWRDGGPVAREDFEIVAIEEPKGYTIGQGRLLDPQRLDRLEVDTGLELKLILRRRGREPFADGFYRLEIEIDLAALAFPDGRPWVGRGGGGLAVFRVAEGIERSPSGSAYWVRGRDARAPSNQGEERARRPRSQWERRRAGETPALPVGKAQLNSRLAVRHVKEVQNL